MALSKCLVAKCYGAGTEAKEMFEGVMAELGAREHEIGTYCDHFLCTYALTQKIFNRPEKEGYEV